MGELEVPLISHRQLTLPPPAAHRGIHHCPPGPRPPTGQPRTLLAVRERERGRGGGREREREGGREGGLKERKERKRERERKRETRRQGGSGVTI